MKRVFIGLLLLIHVGFTSCNLAFALVASRSAKEKIEMYKIDKYKVTLIAKQDWVGPWYYGYEVRKKCCGIYLPKKYYWCHRDSVKNCVVRLDENKIIFNKCEIKKIVK